MTTMATFTVGETAVQTGFSIDTLRYYEREGLLDPVHRSAGGARRYSQSDIDWLNLLSCLRGTGMPIGEMRRFAELLREGDGNWRARRELLAAHRESVLATIADLHRQLERVDEKISYYRGQEAQSESP